MVEKLTDNKNIFLTTESERLAVTPHTQHLYKDADVGYLFYGDGSTVGGMSVDVRPSVNKTANYTLLRKDEGRLIVFNSSSALTLTVPTNANVPFITGLTEIHILNLGSGAVTLSGASGATVSGSNSLAQYTKATIRKTDTDTWVILSSAAAATGDIEGVTAGTGLGGGGTSGTVTLTNTGVTSIVAGTNISISGATGAVTVTGTDTNTQLSTEQVQDIVGAMLVGTETRIGVTYDDTNGRVNFIVDDMTANTQLTTEEVQDVIGAMIAGNTESGITVTYDDTNGKLDLSVASQTENSFTTTLKNKLDAIEASATADQTAAEIRALVEAATDSNVFTDADHSKLNAIEASATADQTASEIRTLVGSATDSNVFTDADHTKLDGVAASANNYAISSDLLDEDNMISNSATKVSTQQSIKAYVDAELAGIVDTAPAALNTLNELAAALGDDANYATTTSTSLGNRLRIDVNTQGLNSTQQGYALTNLGITASLAEINILTSGLAAGDIPSLAASKITSGTFATARIADAAITAGKLNVTGNGSSTQFLRSDGDGSFTWAVPTDTDTNTQLTQEQVEDFVAGVITAGTNVSVTYDDAAGTLTIASTDTNTQLTTEAVQDIVGAMLVGTETRIGVTYDDTNGRIDFVVDDMTANDNTQLSTEQVQDIVGAMFTSNTETRITATYQDGDGTIDLVVDDQSSDNNTTYSISAVDGDNADEEKIRLTDSASGTDDIVLEAGTGLSIARSGDKITFTNTVTNTNTQLTSEQVQDIIGGMVDGGTETNIAVTYDDINAKLNFVSTDTNTTYSVGDGGLTQNNFTTTLKTKLDGIAASSNNYSLPTAGASTLGGVKVGTNLSIDGSGVLSSTDTNTNTQLTTEQVQDIVGGMLVGTETRIGVDYDDTNGRINFVVDDMTANTTYSVGDGGLTEINFTSADNTKLDGIAASANNYVHPNHSGEVTSSADGATVIADNVVDEANLKATNAPTDNYLLSYDEATTGFTWIAAGAGGENNQNAFSNIAVSGQTTVAADAATDTLTLVGGTNVTITTTVGTDTVTFASADTNTQLTQEQVEDYVNGLIVGGTNVTATYDDGAGTLTLASTDTNTQLTTEAVQDIIGAMLVGTETRIGVTYDDTNGRINFVVDDMTANDNTFRTITAGGETLGASETLAFTAGSNVTITELGGAVTIASTDTNTTYSIGAGGLTQENFTTTLKNKLDAIAASANNYAISSDLLDEDAFGSNSATKVASQQSIKAYVDAKVATVVDSAPAALDTLNELAAALGDDANFATTTATSLGQKLVKSSNLSDLTNATTARSNLGLGTAAVLSGTGAVADANAGLVTGNVVYDYIAAQGFGAGSGDITAVVAGTGLSGGATSGSATVNLSHLGIQSLSDPNADRILIWDDSAGAVAWATPNSNLAISGTNLNATDTNTTYSVGAGGLTQENFTTTLKNKLDAIAASANNYTLPTAAAGTLGGIKVGANLTISSGVLAGTADTQPLTTEAVQDIVGGMLVGTETRIGVEYDDTNGRINFVVDDMTANTTYSVGDGGLTQNNFTNTLKSKLDGIAASANNYALTADLASSEITAIQNIGATTISAAQWGYLGAASGAITNTDTNTQNVFTSTWVDSSTNAILRLTKSGASTGTQDLTIVAGSNITLTPSGGNLTIAATDTNTTYSVGAGGLTQENFTTTLKNKLDAIAASANNYTLPEANATTRGGIELFSDTDQSVAATAVSATAARTYGLQLNSAGQGVVNVPWVDTNTTYSVGAGGLTQENFTTTLKNKLDAIAASATANAGTVTSVTAGAGLTQSGTNTVNPTLDVVGGTGITANANDIAIDSTVATLAGVQTLTNKTIAASQVTEISALTAAEGAQLENIGTTTISATQWGYLGAASGAITNTDTTYSVGDGGLTEINFTSADNTKLDGIAASANNYTHTTNANLTGDVTSVGNATTIATDAVDIAMLSATGTASSSTYLRGDNSWATVSSGGASDIGALDDVLMDTTNFISSFLIQTDSDGSAPTTGTLSNASHNIGIGHDVFLDLASGVGNIGLGTFALTNQITGDYNIGLGYNALGTTTQGQYNIGIGYEAGYGFDDSDYNVAIGYRALRQQGGSNNTALGAFAMYGAGASNTANNNVAVGGRAMEAVTTGSNSVFIGYQAGTDITTASSNVGVGYQALYKQTTGLRNVALGANTLDQSTTEADNIAIGYNALGGVIAGGEKNVAIGSYAGDAITTGDAHVLIGYQAGTTMTTAQKCVYIGYYAGRDTTTAQENIGIGDQALENNTTGGSNTSVGHYAMKDTNTGYGNLALGSGALMANTSGQRNVAVGGQNALSSVTTGHQNIALGTYAGDNITTGTGNVVIGRADVPSATADRQLSISAGDNATPVWITGNSSGGINSKAEVVAVAGNTVLTLAQTGAYIYWTAGTLTLPASGTVGTQYTVINNTGGSATVAVNASNCSLVAGFSGATNATVAIADHELASFVCVTANTWIQVG